MMNTIQAEVMQMPVISLHISFSVRVKQPVEMAPLVYTINLQDVIARATSVKDEPRVVYDILTEKVLYDYNKLIEDSPIMDMFEDPMKYKKCSYIDWIFVDLMKGAGLEPATSDSSDRHSTN